MQEYDLAEVKAMAASAGVDIHPDATLIQRDKPAGGRVPIVLVDRAAGGVIPEYCVHGYATCVRCDELCWIGSETSKKILEDNVNPLCMVCVGVLIEQGVWPKDARPDGHVQDHRRADGPHD